MWRALAATGLVLSCSAVLGATVFREQVAQAARTIMAVEVVNTVSEPVPVRQQGTVDANLTNTRIRVAPTAAPKSGAIGPISTSPGNDTDVHFDFGGSDTVTASLVTVTSQQGIGILSFQNTNSTTGTVNVLQFLLQADHDLVVPLVEAVPINRIHLHCSQGPCSAWFNIVGS